MRRSIIATAPAFLALAGCGASPDAGSGSREATAAPSFAPVTCTDDDPRLPGSGLCLKRAADLMFGDPEVRLDSPEGCHWTIGEAAMPRGEYLLYRGLQCGEREAELELAARDDGTNLELVHSAFAPLAEPAVIGHVYPAGREPLAEVTRRAGDAVADAADFTGCTARQAAIAGWPRDALVVDVSAAEASRAPRDEPRTACGPLGLDEDAMTFWRVFQGHAWFFDLGQDTLEIDPGSLTLVRKDDAGEWHRAAS